MTWARATVDGVHRCGSCRSAIDKGELIAYTRTGAERCEACARKIEDPPAVIEDEIATSVPPGVRHQASLGFSSAAELAQKLRERAR